MTVVLHTSWHECGTDTGIRGGCLLTAPEAIGLCLVCYVDLAAAIPSPCLAAFPGRPPSDAQGDNRIDGPPGRPDGDDGEADQDGRGLGGTHQVLGSLACGSTRAEPPPQALLDDPEHRHDDHAAGRQRNAQNRSGSLMVASEVTHRLNGDVRGQ